MADRVAWSRSGGLKASSLKASQGRVTTRLNYQFCAHGMLIVSLSGLLLTTQRKDFHPKRQKSEEQPMTAADLQPQEKETYETLALLKTKEREREIFAKKE
ncbi:hypothetical protein L484_011363 [Morus notabilis]|uniref:Uncharacterized protein n=1 Tax=Morus notabilis TaxID=981085 RepID=W9SGD9_9ROSA|nr:hypothetical protein L484_011363 [Morus notabilis]